MAVGEKDTLKGCSDERGTILMFGTKGCGNGRELSCIRVIDYKTGGKPMKVNTMDDMFVAKAKEQPKYQLQTFLYSLLLSDNLTKEADKQYLITPSLFFVKGMRNKDFVPYVTFADNILYDVRPLLSEVRMRLVRVLSEIIDPDNPFENTGVKDHCKYCIYKPLCGKKEDDIKY